MQTNTAFHQPAVEMPHISCALEQLTGSTLDAAQNAQTTGNATQQAALALKNGQSALDQAIETACAGGHGEGIAAVADEVRSLAKRTQQSTREFQQIIRQLKTTDFKHEVNAA